MAHDQSFFSQARNVGTIYLDREGDYLADVRFCLARHGEDASAVISRFWEEQPSPGLPWCRSSLMAYRPGASYRLGNRLRLHLRASA